MLQVGRLNQSVVLYLFVGYINFHLHVFNQKYSPIAGEEYIRKVEMMYCDLCHKYLDPRIESENDFKILKQKHCLKKEHKNAYSKLIGENEAPKEVSLNTTGVTCGVQVGQFLLCITLCVN